MLNDEDKQLDMTIWLFNNEGRAVCWGEDNAEFMNLVINANDSMTLDLERPGRPFSIVPKWFTGYAELELSHACPIICIASNSDEVKETLDTLPIYTHAEQLELQDLVASPFNTKWIRPRSRFVVPNFKIQSSGADKAVITNFSEKHVFAHCTHKIHVGELRANEEYFWVEEVPPMHQKLMQPHEPKGEGALVIVLKDSPQQFSSNVVQALVSVVAFCGNVVEAL